MRLMNAFGDAAEHAILTAVPDAIDARDAIAPGIAICFPGDAPSLAGTPGLARYRRLARYMAAFDLILSYNWGAMDAVGAARLFPRAMPPLIHHEDGFNADEATRLDWRRNLFRRLTLPAASALVVPSRTLEDIARRAWRRDDVIRIPNGVDTARYGRRVECDAIPGFERRPGDVVIGTVAGLRTVKNLPRLVRAVAMLPDHVRLVIVGDGPERDAIRAEAANCGLRTRLVMPGFVAAPHRYLGLFDIFALSSDSEQFPIALVEAMAAGLPVVSTDVGDVRDIVGPGMVRFVVAADDAALAAGLRVLVDDRKVRAETGAANRARAAAEFGENAMIDRYAALYGLSRG